MSLCKDCVSGVEHDGTPQGVLESIGGVECYIGTPSVDYPKDKVILFLTDVFGISLVNNKLLVDAFARNGFKTILPDYLGGDPIPVDAMTSGTWTQETRAAWKARHSKDVTRPYLDKVIMALTEQGVTSFAATGYCFGARYAVDLALDNPLTQVIALSHPSSLEIPGDFEALRAASRVPILINSCETDSTFPPDAQKTTDAILGNGQYKPGYERTYWPGCAHGFAVRGDMSNPLIKAGFDGSFKATVDFFIKHA